MLNFGIEFDNQLVSDAVIRSKDPDVLLVTNEAEIPAGILLTHVQAGRAALLSNNLPISYFEALGIRRGGIQLINIQADPTQPVIMGFQGLSSSPVYPVRVYWHAATNPDTLYSLEATAGAFDSTRSYGSNTVVAGITAGAGYLFVIPSAVFRSDSFYAKAEGADPSNPPTRNQAFLADAIQHAYSKLPRASPSPTPAPAAPPPPAATPAPATAPPPTPPPTTPIPAAAPPATSAAAPASSFPAAMALAAIVIILVAVIVGARMRKRKPPPESAPGVGMGREEVPPETPAASPSEEPPPPTPT
jgi:hypothetical protein